MPRLLRIDRGEGVARVTLDRPDKRNALSLDMRLEMADAFAALAADESVRCAILTGAGSAFCSGMDTGQFGGDVEHRRRIVDTSLRAFGAVSGFPKPLIAAVNGPAIAGGFVLALRADLRIAARSARFGFAELPRGIPPSYAAARLVLPDPLARELCLTGRLLDAEQARDCGLVSDVVPDGEALGRAEELAAAVAGLPPWTTREIKRRFLVATQAMLGPSFADEERSFRAALLGGEGA